MRWGCLVLVLALVAGAIGFVARVNHRMVLNASGTEYPPQEKESWLKQCLESRFRWAGLPGNRIEGCGSTAFKITPTCIESGSRGENLPTFAKLSCPARQRVCNWTMATTLPCARLDLELQNLKGRRK